MFYQWDGGVYVDNPCPSYDRKYSEQPLLNLAEEEFKIIGASGDLCFSINSEGVLSAYALDSFESEGADPLWTVETGDVNISEVRVVSAYGIWQLFAFSKEAQKLYHCPIVKDICSGRLVCIPLETGVMNYSLDAGPDYMHLSIVKGDVESPQIVHFSMLPDGSEWKENGLYLESEDKVQKIQGHITDLVFCEKDNSPIPDQRVKLWTSEDMTLYIGGKMLRVGPETPYIVQGNAVGSLEIVEESDSLNGAVIIFREVDESDTPKGLYYTVTPGEKYKAKLKGMTKEELDSAVTSTGERLVDDDFDDQRSEVLGHAVDAMHNMLEGTEICENGELQRIKVDNQTSEDENCLRTACYMEDPTPYFGKIIKNKMMKSCIIQCSEGKLSYRQVSSQEAYEHMANTYRTVYGSDGFVMKGEKELLEGNYRGVFSSIASFFKAVVKGIVDVAEIVVHAAETVVTATVHFIDNMVHKAVSFVVTVVKDAVHLVEGVLKQIKVGFEKVIQWIGFMLDWKDIQNSAKYIEQQFETGISQINQALDDTEAFADQKFDGAEEKLKAYFARFHNELSDEDLKAKSSQASEDNPINQADAHNVVKKHLGEGNIDLQEISVSLSSEEEKALEDFATVADRISGACVLDPTALLEELKRGKCSLRLIGDALMDMIGTLLENALEIARDELHIFIGAIKVLLNLVRGILTNKIRVPVISALIKTVTGMDLTIMNLASFGIAIPYTIACKLLYHEAPVQHKEGFCFLADEEKKNILAIVLFGFASAAQAVVAGMMCAKRKSDIWIPASVELSCLIGFVCAASEELGKKVDPQFFGALSVIAIVECLCDILYSRWRSFRTDGTYYSMKLLICAAGCIIQLVYLLTDSEKCTPSLGLPGGILYSLEEALACCFYRMRSGNNAGLVAIVVILGIVASVMNGNLLGHKTSGSTESYLENYVSYE